MTNKQKNSFLLIGFVAMLVVVYQFAIKKTISLKNSSITLQQEKSLLDNAAVKILNLQQQNKYLDSILNTKNVSIENSFQQLLLKRVGTYASKHHLQIISFQKPHEIKGKEVAVLTYSFEVQGTFNSLLSFIHFLEQQALGEFISIRYQKKKNYRINKEYVTATIYLQRLSR